MNNFEILSKMSVDQKIRSCAFDADGSHIALGLTDGSFMVLKTRYVKSCFSTCIKVSLMVFVNIFCSCVYTCTC